MIKGSLINYGDNARNRLLAGVDIIANAVKTTLGAKGRNVIYQPSPNYPPIITKDGVTVAKWVNSTDPIERIAINTVKQAALASNEEVGDGTTTATVLTQKIFQEGLKVLKDRGGVELKRELDNDLDYCLKELDKLAKPIETEDELIKVATISTNGDTSLGELIGGITWQVGKEGAIITENNQNGTTETEFIEGYNLNEGMIHPAFAIDKVRVRTEIGKPLVLVTDETISLVNEMLPAIEYALANKRPLVIICNDMDFEALPFLIMNFQNDKLFSCVIKVKDKDIIEDLAIYTGATMLSDKNGITMRKETFKTEFLGTLDKAIIERTKSVFIRDKQNNKLLEDRISILSENKDNITRVAQLKGKIGVIKVGASTLMELDEMKFRVEDAVRATKVALEEGVVAGGGSALASITPTGLLAKCLREPLQCILNNAGLKDDVFWTYPFGIDVSDNDKCNLIKKGIIDPVKVVKCALKHAVSIAGLLLTTEVVIANEEKEVTP